MKIRSNSELDPAYVGISAGRAQSSLPEQLSCRRRVSRCVAGYAAGYSTEGFAKTPQSNSNADLVERYKIQSTSRISSGFR